jgi:hypothetical protein
MPHFHDPVRLLRTAVQYAEISLADIRAVVDRCLVVSRAQIADSRRRIELSAALAVVPAGQGPVERDRQ